MAINFFYHDPLDDKGSGGSHMMCEASCEGQRTGPYTAKLKIWTRFVAKRGTASDEFEYDVVIDNASNSNGEDVHRRFKESFSAGKEWNFYDEVDFSVTKAQTKINASFYAYRLIEEGNETGYEETASAYIPAWITAPIVSNPVISDIRVNQVSFSWNVIDSGGEDPAVYTDIYNYPGYTSRWIGLNELGYGNISTGTIMGLNRYTSYALRGHAENSQGETYSDEVWFRTIQEAPSVGSVLISNIGSETANYSFPVVDNGGKPVEKYALYIIGGQYSDWTKVGSSNSGTLTGLLHNTNYELRGYATNDSSASDVNVNDTKFTGVGTGKFITLGDPATIDEFRAETIEKNKIVLTYSASYDLNSSFKTYLIQYKEANSSSWISLRNDSRTITGLKSNQKYDVKISVTDVFNRVITSEICVFTLSDEINLKLNKPIISVSGNNVTFTEDFVIPNNSSMTISENMMFMVTENGLENAICLKSFGSGNNIRSFTFDSKLAETYMHPYKKYSFYYVLIDNYGNIINSEYEKISLKEEDKTIKKIESNGDITSFENISVIDQGNAVTKLDKRSFVKLSSNMRYIAIGSSGMSSHSAIYPVEIARDFEFLHLDLKVLMSSFSKNVASIIFSSLKLSSNDSKQHNISNNSLGLRVYSYKENETVVSDIMKIKNIEEISPSEKDLFASSIETIYLNMKDCKGIGIEIIVYKNNSFTNKSHLRKYLFSGDEEFYQQLNNSFSDNSLVEIDVYDNSDNIISSGKTIKTNQSNINVISVNGGNATNGDHSDPSKFVRTNGADTMILDLGQEYNINKVNIWRRWSENKNGMYNLARFESCSTSLEGAGTQNIKFKTENFGNFNNQCYTIFEVFCFAQEMVLNREVKISFDAFFENIEFGNGGTPVLRIQSCMTNGSSSDWGSSIIGSENMTQKAISGGNYHIELLKNIDQRAYNNIINGLNHMNCSIRFDYCKSGTFIINNLLVGFTDSETKLNSDFIYANNFVYGLNKNKEICYKFHNGIGDSTGYIEDSFGKSFEVFK